MFLIPMFMIVFFSAFLMLFLAAGLYATDRTKLEQYNQAALDGKATASMQELSMPFFDRLLKPFMLWLSRIARRLTPKGMVEKTYRQLSLTGYQQAVDRDKFLAVKALCSLGTMIVVILIGIVMIDFSLRLVIGGGLLSVAAFFVPNLWLYRKIEQRKRAISVALPDTLDLLTISVEAGLGFDAALSKVANNTRGPLSEEFFRMLQEISLGTPRAQALRALADRTDVPELNSFVIAMLQADVFGISIGKVLRVQANEMRTKRRQKAEEIAMKTPVKIVFPLVLCIFPALLVVVLGPAAISIYQAVTTNL